MRKAAEIAGFCGSMKKTRKEQAEIEITPEMIEAGARVADRLIGAADVYYLVREIFVEMSRARRPTINPQKSQRTQKPTERIPDEL